MKERCSHLTHRMRLAIAGALSAIIFLQGGTMTALEKMTLKGTIEQLRKRTKIVTLGDEKGVFLALAPEYGARVVGMTSGGIEGDNLLWINPKVMDDSFWSAAKISSSSACGAIR